CASRPGSPSKASKMPKVAGPKRRAYQTEVSRSSRARASAPSSSLATSFSLPGFACRRANNPTLTMTATFPPTQVAGLGQAKTVAAASQTHGYASRVSTTVRTALVTGANRGLGLETARQLAAGGTRVIVTSRVAAAARAAAQALAANAPPGSVVALAAPFDVADA